MDKLEDLSPRPVVVKVAGEEIEILKRDATTAAVYIDGRAVAS